MSGCPAAARGLARREHGLGRHRGLLPHPVRHRLRPDRRFDHDFIGRDALERDRRRCPPREGHARVEPRRRRGGDAFALRAGVPAKYIDLPKARYATYQVGPRAARRRGWSGISHDVGYIANEQALVSLARSTSPPPSRERRSQSCGARSRTHASPRSSLTARSRSARLSHRFRMRNRPASRTAATEASADSLRAGGTSLASACRPAASAMRPSTLAGQRRVAALRTETEASRCS